MSSNEDLDALESGRKKRTLFQTPGTFTPGMQGDTARRISDQFTPRTPFTKQQQRYVNALPSILRTSTKQKPSHQQEEASAERSLSEQQDNDGVRVTRADPDGESEAGNDSEINVQCTRSRRGRDGTQRSKFVRDEDLGEEFMFEVDVTLRKQDYGEPGSHEYRKNKEMATRALAEKFGVARHKIVSDAEEGDVSKHMHVQQVIVSILHRVKEGHERCKQMDFMDLCKLADFTGDTSSTNCVDWWGHKEINIWTDWELLTEEHVRAWQYSINLRFSDEDRIASSWLKEFVYNSSTDSLRTAVDKRYSKLDINQRGGVMYLYYSLTEMFVMSREVTEAMKYFIDLFKKKGVARYTGENVLQISEELLGVAKRLDSVALLTYEHVHDILSGLCICTNARFRDTFKLLRQNADLGVLHNTLRTIPVDATPLEEIEAVLDFAVDMYDKLSVAQLWIKPGKGGGNTALNTIVKQVTECWNCGEKGHTAQKCPHPKNPELYNKNRKAFMDKKSANNNNGSGGGKNNNSGGGKGNANPGYDRKAWEAKLAKQNIKIDTDGVLKCFCKKCGLNTTHSTGFHKVYVLNPAGFSLPDSHPYIVACAQLRALQGTHTPTHKPPPTTQTSGEKTAGHAGSISRAHIEQKLADLERTSTDPNAASIAETIRSIFLN